MTMAEQKISIQVGGMSCAMCAKNIEYALKSLPGVIQSNVNFASETADVLYTQGADITAMKRAIEDAGYTVLSDLDEIEAEKHALSDLASKRNKAVTGIAAGICAMALMYIKLPAEHRYVLFVFSIIPFFYTSTGIFKAAFRSLKHFNLTMDVMYALGHRRFFYRKCPFHVWYFGT